jgi:hypothetical protein
MAIYEFLIRGNQSGQITGAQILRFGPQGEIGPAGLSALTPEELAQIPDWAIELMASPNNEQAIAALQTQISQLQQTIEAQRQQLSDHVISDWSELQTALLDAGLATLIAEIVTISKLTQNPPGENLDAEVLLLITAADAAIKRADRIAVIEAYQALLGHPSNGTGFVPKLLTINPAAAAGLMGLIATTMPNLQAVLDDRGIPPSLLRFVG